jgi:hypothetical protein
MKPTKSDKMTKFRRRVNWAALVVVVVALAYFFTMYGSWTVLKGMDTMPDEYPPGATCIIKKNPGGVQKDSVVVIGLPGGAALLTRVDRIEADRFFIRHDNRESVFLHYEKQSYPMSAVRGLVLSALLPDPDDSEDPRGK